MKQVSERCGIDVGTLRKLDNGKQANPALFTMLLYLGAVGKRLHFSVHAKSPAATNVSEIHEADAVSNGAARTAGSRAKRARGKSPADRR